MLLGVNVHDNLGPNTPYADAANVLEAIKTLGARVVRGLNYDRPGGIRLCADNGLGVCIMPPPEVAKVTVATYKPVIDIAKKAGVWLAIEGLNEPENKTPADPHFKNWINYVRAHQTTLHNVGKELGVTVLGPSIGTYAASDVGKLPADRLNVHSYAWPHSSVPNIADDIAACQVLAPGKRPLVTECGVSTVQVSEAAQAQILAAAWDRAKAAGVTVFCPYELVDQWRTPFDWGNSERNFGLFRHDWTPKPVVDVLKAKATA